ncbi:MAG: methyltransferase [Sporichthyaceae bacterium]
MADSHGGPVRPASCAGADRLRDAFLSAGFTVDGVADLLGPVAQAALARHETVPARRAAAGGGQLGTLVRMLLLQQEVPQAEAAAVLPLDVAVALGVLGADGDEVRARVDVRPHSPGLAGVAHGESHPTGEGDAGGERWWVVSDLGTGLDGVHRPLDGQHVLGVGGASTTLAQLTPRDPVDRTLDVGTGCGVHALHAARHSRQVVATDVSRRALQLAGLTAALSGVTVDLREGDLLHPVADEAFDLVVSNPPFVIGAPESRTYRDSGLPLDTVGARLAGEAPGLLTEGGTLVMLANWVHRQGADWQDRVTGWLPAHGVDALLVQRELLDPAAYVATWLADAGERGDPSYVRRYDAWLDALGRERVDAVGFGVVVLRRTDAERRVTTLDWPHPVEQPLGPHLAGWLDRQRWLAAHEDDDALGSATVRLAPDVVQEQIGAPGAEDPEHVVLRQQVGLRRAFAADTGTAALVGACDGTLPVGTLVGAVRQVLGDDGPGGHADLLAQVRVMVEAGVLTPSP